MSHDSDIAEMGRALTQRRKDRHSEWRRKNMLIIQESAIPHRSANGGETLLFRDNGMCVDFFPSTGRWREPRENRTYRGGVQAFLRWVAGKTGGTV